ncbi:hypothetical protein [Amycolatopsis sp. cg13]|uniref:hypothetical protein n=1 Tax=Amycolatopsis sp. cg13 TaxID=3238807 RepID=UPI003523D863
MAFNATWTPGPEAVAGMHVSGPEALPGFVCRLGKDSPPTDPTQWQRFALHRLCAEADQLLAVLDTSAGQAHDN